MSTIDTGGPAFPRPAVFTATHGLASPEQDGMDLRDYFAAHATDADLEKYLAIVSHEEQVVTNPWTKEVTLQRIYISREEARYRYADAMLKARR